MNPFAKLSIEKREDVSPIGRIIAIIVALIAAMLISAILIQLANASPLEAFTNLFKGAFGNKRAILETLVKATPLILTGLATVIAFQGKIWSIGQEGQFFLGAIGGYWAYRIFEGLPALALVPIIIVAGIITGGVGGMIAGLLKAYFNVDVIISTVMGNYIIDYLLSFLLSGVGPWREPGSYYQQTAPIAGNAYYPILFTNSRLHIGFLIAIICSMLVYLILNHTPFGYQLRAFGSNPQAAKFKGININKIIIVTMFISGALAGLAGAGELFGVQYRLRPDLSPGYGYTGIIVAMVAGLNPIGVIPAAILFGAIINGSAQMRIATGVPTALTFAIQAIVLLSLLSAQVFTRFRVRRAEHVD
jgi:general nucleoside transport system permease protein